jgi:hypothetical protein
LVRAIFSRIQSIEHVNQKNGYNEVLWDVCQVQLPKISKFRSEDAFSMWHENRTLRVTKTRTTPSTYYPEP